MCYITPQRVEEGYHQHSEEAQGRFSKFKKHKVNAATFANGYGSRI